MKKELDEKLVAAFPLLYKDRHESMQETAMCWGFACGDGWFDIIWDLSSKLEPLIEKYIKDNPNSECTNCACTKDKHYGSKTRNVGKCLAIHTDPDSEELPPGNYFACFCDVYSENYPRAAQVKEKFGMLSFYMTQSNDEIRTLIRAAERSTQETCEACGKPGSKTPNKHWAYTRCGDCSERNEDRS